MRMEIINTTQFNAYSILLYLIHLKCFQFKTILLFFILIFFMLDLVCTVYKIEIILLCDIFI